MKRIIMAAALALAVTLPAVQAQAQSIRTFVSTAGSDSNPCSLASPCRHFSAAVAVTSPGGEVDALDRGAYGSFTISHAITIEGQGWSYVAPPANGAAITVTAGSTDKINIRGVSLNGVGVANATGVAFNSVSSLNVQDCVIRNFTLDGISCQPNTSSRLHVSNTLASDNGHHGIFIVPSGSGITTGVLDHVHMENNHNSGFFVNTATQDIRFTVSESVSANNAGSGIDAESSNAAASVNVMVRNSTIADNSGDGLAASGAAATLRVTRSTITGNGTGWIVVSSGVVTSYADNNIDGNVSVNTAPPAIGYK